MIKLPQFKKENVADLRKGRIVYSNEEIGVVVKSDWTFLHEHSFADVRWFRSNGSTYKVRYLAERKFMVHVLVIPKEKKH